MLQPEDKRIKRILEPHPLRVYMGDFSAEELSSAFSRIKRSHQYNVPQYSTTIRVGEINGDVICNALWNEMTYNPVRFGTASPFMFRGRNNIFKFCETPRTSDTDDEGAQVLAQVRHHLIRYMTLNAEPNGAWRDVISTPNGFIDIGITADGHSDTVYKMLANLRDCIKVIARQNVSDFKKKRGPYRAEIIATVRARHPRGFRPNVPAALPKIATPVANQALMHNEITFEYDYEARLDNMMESAQITLNNAQYVSPDIYAQAMADYQTALRRASERQY